LLKGRDRLLESLATLMMGARIAILLP